MSWFHFLRRRRKEDRVPRDKVADMSLDEASIVVAHTVLMKWLSDTGQTTHASAWLGHELTSHFGLTPEQAMAVIQAAFRHMHKVDEAANLIKLAAADLSGRPS